MVKIGNHTYRYTAKCQHKMTDDTGIDTPGLYWILIQYNPGVIGAVHFCA